MKTTILAFDFDGTITRKDSLIEFLKFTGGNLKLFSTFAFYFPILSLAKLNLYPHGKVKEKIFSRYFKGLKLKEFNKLCEDFAKQKFESLVYKEAENEIKINSKKDNTIIIITASIENWVNPFAIKLGCDKVIGTKIEVDNNEIITGRFSTPNCNREEKVKRLMEVFPKRTEYKLIAYGDSKGDRELMNFADKSFYKKFR